MLPTTKHDQEIVRVAGVFREFIQSPGWIEYVNLCQQQRDRWTMESATNQSAEYHSFCCGEGYATNILCAMPGSIIRRADEIMLEMQRQAEQDKENQAQQPERMGNRQPPQPV